MIDISKEVYFQTTRSGGKGGQHVNKVETAVIAFFPIHSSRSLSTQQKELLLEKLSNRINSEGILQVKSQTHRTQLANKDEAFEKINKLVHSALLKKKARIATKVSRAIKEKRLETKKRQSDVKSVRKKLRPGDY